MKAEEKESVPKIHTHVVKYQCSCKPNEDSWTQCDLHDANIRREK